MPSQTLIDVVLALATAEFFHATSEMLSARFKATQLAEYVAHGHARELPVNVDTRPKAYAVLVTVAIVLFGVSFGIFTALAPSGTTAFTYLAVVLVLTYAVTGAGFDGFHVVMGRLARQFRR